ncbi:class I SAM-dependent methyltransferase [Ruminococcus sp.]|uniref:class I SAM-dependent methyltransferase n=1 Tax=Ruminococcus sp. TaxID=41978 RepID=UPI0025D48602|nr:class I SAM-dependent methyltransferase [Ruminococcus sp.]MBQ8967574.1 methyltransferase domain-containing protein [Ruminococcus sp.]
MDNTSAFSSNAFDENIRKVIPLYDVIYDEITDLIKVFCGDRKIALLDTGCGTGTFAEKALAELDIGELVLCDPSAEMLDIARQKTKGHDVELICKGSEKLAFNGKFDVVTAIQCHHYFDRPTRETAVRNCFNALKDGGIFIYFENTAPFTDIGREIMLDRVASFGLKARRTEAEVTAHRLRYGKEFFPLNIKEHLELLEKAGFERGELFWHSYMQSGFYGIKGHKEG